MKINEIGNRYGKLTVIDYANSINKRAVWKCKCDCGNICEVKGKYLRNGDTTSCGCFSKERTKQMGLNNKKPNKIIIEDNLVKVFFHNTDNFFICDLQDLELVKNGTWFENEQGYARTLDNNKFKFFHNYIIPNNNEMCCDHINGNRLDNRRCNLRSVTKQQNALNTKMYKNNTSGHTGVYKRNNSWIAYINYKNEYINIGSFKTKEEAIEARQQKEIELFGVYRRGA